MASAVLMNIQAEGTHHSGNQFISFPSREDKISFAATTSVSSTSTEAVLTVYPPGVNCGDLVGL